MTLTLDAANELNGLQVWPRSANLAGYNVTPNLAQLSWLETAVNACSFDWNRLRPVCGQVNVYWVAADVLYAGHLGLFANSNYGLVDVPRRGVSERAYAPATPPAGSLGDYGAVDVGFFPWAPGASADIYLLSTLGLGGAPYDDPRFYMETVTRLLGMVTVCKLGCPSQWHRDRLARCFMPVDRPDFGLQTGVNWHQVPLEERDDIRPLPELGQTLYETNVWAYESLGVNCEETRVLIEGGWRETYHIDRYATVHNDFWGVAPAPHQRDVPWALRLIEGAAEAFKDTFAPKLYRRHFNRTQIKLKGRAGWERFVALLMDEIPLPDLTLALNGGGGGYDYRAYDEERFNEISQQWETISHWEWDVIDETTWWFPLGIEGATNIRLELTPVADDARVDDSEIVYETTDENGDPVFTPGAPDYAWTFSVTDISADPPVVYHSETTTTRAGALTAVTLPLAVAGHRMHVRLEGHSSLDRLPESPIPIEGIEAGHALSPPRIFHLRNGFNNADVEVQHIWRATSPTGAHPLYPYEGELAFGAGDSGKVRK